MIKVKYLDKSITKLEKNENGDLIDLRVSTKIVVDMEQLGLNNCSYYR